jgi:hypothetical protein
LVPSLILADAFGVAVVFDHEHQATLNSPISGFHPLRGLRVDGTMVGWRASKGFTAPSASFPGARISLECVRYFDGERYSDCEWRTNVFAEDGNWVDHQGADNVQDSLDAMIEMLMPFYDGKANWVDDDTGESLTFWEMVIRTLPGRLGPRSRV